MVDSIVTRTIGYDYIYLDLIFLAIWILFIIKKRYWVPFLWGIMGWLVYLFVDYYLWFMIMESRTYEGDINPSLFFLWFCFSPGFVQFSYVAIMFEKRNFRELVFWTIFFFAGWILIGILSQIFAINDTVIRVSRNMSVNNQRLTFTLMTIGNIIIGAILVVFKKIRVEDLVYLFIVGTLVELSLELSLSVSGIRLEQGTWSFELFMVNSLIEFNMGIIIMFLLWTFVAKGPKRMFVPMLGWKDFPHIKTDFNLISAIQSEPTAQRILLFRTKKIVSRYPETMYRHDLEYMQQPPEFSS